MSIIREIEVTRKGLARPIDVTYGTNMLQIEFVVTDFILPEGATSQVFAMDGNKNVKSQPCTVSGNKISFEPKVGLFEEGKNILQLAVSYNGKNLFTFYQPVTCHYTMQFEGAQDLENDPTFAGMVMQMQQEIAEISETKVNYTDIEETLSEKSEKPVKNKTLFAKFKDITDSIKSILTKLGYLLMGRKTPQMYGAIGNANYFNDEDKQWYVDEEYTTLANDDTQAFKDALKEAVNGTLYIPKGEGTYYLLREIAIPSNVKIVAGRGVKIVFAYDSGFGFSMHDKENITITGSGDFELVNIRGYYTSSTQHTFYLLRSKHITIENLIIRDSDGDGIYIGGGAEYAYNEHITVRNVQIYNSKRNNISITHGKHIILDGCILNDIQAEDSQAPQGGLDIEANNDCVCEDIYVVNCIANNNKGNGYYCVRACKNVVFENCIAENNAYNFGIDGTELGYLAKDITCINCRSIDTIGTIKDGFSTSKAERVKFINCHSEGCSIGFGIYNKSVGIIIDSCISKNQRNAGFHVETPSGNVDEYAENIIITNCISDGDMSGIGLKQCKNVTVDSCSVKNAASGHGIALIKANNCVVSGNRLLESVLSGIYNDSSTDITIQGNQLESNRACGILVAGSSERVLVDNNYLLNNAIYARPEDISFTYYCAGIKIQSGNDCIVKNNKVRITEEYDVSTIKPAGISLHLYGQATNCYVAGNDVYNGGYYSYELFGSTDYGNVDGGGNRKKDGSLLSGSVVDSYSKDEIDNMFGNYVTEVAELIGGDA